MTSGEVTTTAPWENKGSNNTISPKIGIVVTADVRVVQFRSSHSLGCFESTKRTTSSILHCLDAFEKFLVSSQLYHFHNGLMLHRNCERKCTIVTSLSALIKDSLDRNLKSPCSSRSTNESNTGSVKAPEFSTQSFDQPVVRRSKKHTQLNCAHITEITSSRRAQIDRTVILPYLGCTRGYTSFRSSTTRVFIKSSKSWEDVGKSNKSKNFKPFLSQTCINGSQNITQSEQNDLDYQVLTPIELLVYSSEEYELEGYNILEDGRSFYLLKTPVSRPKQILSGNRHIVCSAPIGSEQNNKLSLPNNNELEKNLTGFDKELFPATSKVNLKATRNVSILHRPKTRDKFTSTSSLDKQNFGNDLDKSIKGLLLPYVSNGRDFPSEIALKLVPKAEVLKSTLNETADQRSTSQSSSEANLLAPRLNTETDCKKKSSKNFWNCFSSKKKKKTSDTYSSLDSNSKEVYFPSIVEVHKDKN